MQRKVTIIYYCDDGLELHHKVKTFDKNEDGRVIIPQDFKDGKSIIAVCDGEVEILNKVGDRILSVNYVA
ncbi:TIGR02922 family protein [Colwellia sp. 39_35_sub15_T18]|nr:TIGR02922 family protein [Colwellia sp. 39_35_sub15_T18]